MIPRYRALAQRIQLELTELDRTQATVNRHWQQARVAATDQDAYVNSVALNLHSFYSGLERIFELIAVEIDGGALGGADWHREMLRQVALDLAEIRPAVIQPETALLLDDYRKFRHRVRNIYATNLDPLRMEVLVVGLPELWKQIQEDLQAFIAFLVSLSRADDDDLRIVGQ